MRDERVAGPDAVQDGGIALSIDLPMASGEELNRSPCRGERRRDEKGDHPGIKRDEVRASFQRALRISQDRQVFINEHNRAGVFLNRGAAFDAECGCLAAAGLHPGECVKRAL